MPNTDEGVRRPAAGRGEASGLLDLIRQLSRAGTEEQIMAVVSHGVRTLLHADGATFGLRDGDRCYYAEEDAVSPLWKGRRFPMGACISGWCMTRGQAVAIPDIHQDARVPADAYRPTFVRSLAMAPVGEDEPVAAIGAYWSELRQPRPEEVELLQAIADAAALSVANVQLQQGAPARRRGQRTPTPPAAKPDAPRQSADRAGGPLREFFGRVRREGLRQNSLESYAFAVICVVFATLLREGGRLSGVQHGLAIYSTYYPAAVLAMLVGGRGAGILASALGGLAAYLFFMSPLYVFAPLTLADALNLTLYGGSCGLIIVIIDWYKRTVLRLKEEDAKHLTLAREQAHRVTNAVSVIEAVVQQSLRDLPERARTINRRMRASLAQIDIGGSGGAEATRLRDVLTAELAPYDLARFTLKGEDEARLSPQSATILALAAHELATNAVKYGALSAPGGRVSVAWERSDGRANIVWRETDGPRVEPPRRRGYGSIMLRRLIEGAGGALTIEFRPSGVIVEISLAPEAARRS